MSVAIAEPRQLSVDDVDFYNEHGYLRLKQVFDPQELTALSEELDHIIQYFATHGKGWSGPWRKQLMQSDVETKSLLVTIHELQSYSAAWARALVQERLVQSIADIIGPELEFHHSTLHAKGPDTGTPFPMHQDYPFYPHQDGRYIDAILHIDTADETSGCLKFLEGSHKLGPLEHSREGSPHLDQSVYRLQDAVSVPADPGDVVLFSIWTIHGSALNEQPRWRRVVRFGYRNPRNLQVSGQAMGRPGTLVRGVRPKLESQSIEVYGNWGPQAVAPRDDD